MAGIFEDLTMLALKHHAVNLGQGFPDFPPARRLLKALSDVTNRPNPMLHQYTRSFGHGRLVRALARLHSGPLARPLDPHEEVLVSLGAYGALVCAITGLVGPGDEVILIEPFFDCYLKMLRNVGATPVYVTLRPQRPGPQGCDSQCPHPQNCPRSARESEEAPPVRRIEEGLKGFSRSGERKSTKVSADLCKEESRPRQDGRTSTRDWKLDMSELEGKITPRTRAIILNNPSNPLGKVFSQQELDDLALVCRRHDLICISDEVYEWLIYDGASHIKIASLPGMWERTVTIGSAGKMFCATGWKIGWVIAPEPLMTHVRRVHQNCYYRPATPLQEALAEAVEAEVSSLGCGYTAELSLTSQGKRDRLAAMLESVGLRPVIPEGAYFLLADVTPLLQQEASLKNVAEEAVHEEKKAEDVNKQEGDKVGSASPVSTSKPALADVTSPSRPRYNLPIAPYAQDHNSGDNGESPDIGLVRRLVMERGIAAIPISPFYSQENKVKAGCFLRFCFVKSDVTLDKAEQRFREWAYNITR